MKKLEIKVTPSEWGDLNTKYPPESEFAATNELTEGSFNVDTSRKGVLTKRPGSVTYSTLPNAPKDQYEAIFSDGTRHLLTVDNGNLRYTSGDGSHTLVLAGLSTVTNCEFATTQDRVYFGNSAQKKVYDRVTSYGGVTYTFPTQTTKNMGCQAPGTAATATLAAGGSVPDGAHTYKVTFLYYGSEESNGSGSSNSVTAGAGNNTVNLTSVPIGGYGVTARKIYRDNADGNYYLVGVVSNNTTTTFSDTINTVSTPMPTDNNIPPDFTLITLYLDKLFLAGIPGDPYTIFYSAAALPDVYPSENTITCNEEDPITGIVVYLDRLVVFNRKSMGQVLGQTPDQFRYASLENSVGCIDNRSIQVRVIDGVPTLIWLSDRGFYGYDGNSIVYLSDKIENLVNLEIQQASIQKGRNAQSSYTDFTQGVSSNGINLEVAPGTITTKGPFWDTAQYPLATYEEQTNPKIIYDTTLEWESGVNLINLATKDTSDANKFKSPLPKTYDFSGGTHNNTIYNPTYKLTMTSSGNNTGEGDTTGTLKPTTDTYTIAARKFVVPRAGTVTNLKSKVTGLASTPRYKIAIYADSSLSVLVYETPDLGSSSAPYPDTDKLNANVSVALSAGTYYIGLHIYNGYALGGSGGSGLNYASDTNYTMYYKRFSDGVVVADPNKRAAVSYTFVQSAIPATGQWTSEIYDSYLYSNANALSMKLGNYGYTPSGTTASVTVQQSDVADLSSSTDLSTSLTNSEAIFNFTATKRYWRIKWNLATNDDRNVPYITGSVLKFPLTSQWFSDKIDCTSNVTAYTSAVMNYTLQPGTTATLEAASSPDNITYTPYGAISSILVQRYIKFRVTLTAPGGFQFTSKVSSITFNWKLQATFQSITIDTGVTPSGWDVFQTTYNLNGGTAVFYMRSGPDLVLESGVNVPGTSPSTPATWYQVYNGEFPSPSIPAQRYVQWRVIITSETDKVPTVDSVTVSWFIGSSTSSIRCASIFFNKNYYLAASEFGSTSNSLLFMLDFKGKWRILRGINVSTFSYFFNNPYFGDAVTYKICKFWEGNNDSGGPIAFDFRSRSMDFSSDYVDNEEKIKILDSAILIGKNTGASYTCYYSLDDGATFNLLYTTDGLTTWSTTTDNKKFIKFLRPNYQTSIGSGRNIMFRAYNNDTNEVELDGFKMTAFVRTQPPIITG